MADWRSDAHTFPSKFKFEGGVDGGDSAATICSHDAHTLGIQNQVNLLPDSLTCRCMSCVRSTLFFPSAAEACGALCNGHHYRHCALGLLDSTNDAT